LARRNRGYASCSIAWNTYSFCGWNISGTCATAAFAISKSGDVGLGRECEEMGKVWTRREGGR
jgi:hypothetical protein